MWARDEVYDLVFNFQKPIAFCINPIGTQSYFRASERQWIPVLGPPSCINGVQVVETPGNAKANVTAMKLQNALALTSKQVGAESTPIFFQYAMLKLITPFDYEMAERDLLTKAVGCMRLLPHVRNLIIEQFPYSCVPFEGEYGIDTRSGKVIFTFDPRSNGGSVEGDRAVRRATLRLSRSGQCVVKAELGRYNHTRRQYVEECLVGEQEDMARRLRNTGFEGGFTVAMVSEITLGMTMWY